MATRGSAEWKAKISAANKGKRSSPKSEFQKGLVPWNKGRKGIHLSRATEFKKGCLCGQAARNLKARGTLSIRKNMGKRQRMIKVRDDGPPQHRWIPLARFWWEHHRGPIPRGCFVVHRDGNTLNDNPANLMLMDRKNLLQWQRTIRPQMESTRKKASAAAQRLRWRVYRFRKEQAARRKAAS